MCNVRAASFSCALTLHYSRIVQASALEGNSQELAHTCPKEPSRRREPEEELLSLLSRAQAPASEDALARIGVCGCHAKASMPSILCFISSTTACTHGQAKLKYQHAGRADWSGT